MSVIAEFPVTSTPLLDLAQITTAGAVLVLLWQGIAAARHCDIPCHRAAMIRICAVGMGSLTMAFVLGPVHLITQEAPVGLLSDVIFVAIRAADIALTEAVLTRILMPALHPATP